MTAKNTIIMKLMKSFSPTKLCVIDQSAAHAGHIGSKIGGETHFDVYIMADAFANKSRLQRHRMVYAALGDILEERVHAISLHVYTLGEPMN